MRRRGLLLACAAVAAARAPAARAQGARKDPTALPQGAAPPATGPAAPIDQLDEALLRIMKLGHGEPFAARAAVLQPVVEQVFDLPQILQVSVGLSWPSIPDAQKAKLLDVFTRYTVASWVANFDSYGGQHFEILSGTRAVGRDQIVRTTLVSRSGERTRLDYQMRDGGTGWKVVDVLQDGSISRVAVQRSDFRALLMRGGPNKLIAELEHKVADLQSGLS